MPPYIELIGLLVLLGSIYVPGRRVDGAGRFSVFRAMRPIAKVMYVVGALVLIAGMIA